MAGRPTGGGAALSGRRILHGTLALTASGLFSRLAGSLYRILLVRIVGEAGIGLFQMALPLLGLAINLATLGLPSALATVVAERAAKGDWSGVEEARRFATRLVLATAVIVAGLTWFGAGFLSNRILTDTRTHLSIAIMPPAIVAASAAMVLRGYFQGLQDLVPSAVAQVVEQSVRIATVLTLAILLLPYGLAAAAGGAMAGLACGELAGLAVLLIRHRWLEASPRPWRRPPRRGTGESGGPGLGRNLMSLALPVMLAGLASSFTATFDVMLIPRRLQVAGFSGEEATVLYGHLAGMAMPLLFLPMVAVFPLMTSLTPAISAAAVVGNRPLLQARVRLGVRLTLAVALAAGLFFLLFPRELAAILYGNPDIAPLVTWLALAAPPTYMQHLEDAILTGLGLTVQSLRNYVIGIAVRLAAIYLLTGSPALGILGALLGIVAGQAVMGLLHARDIRRATGRYPAP